MNATGASPTAAVESVAYTASILTIVGFVIVVLTILALIWQTWQLKVSITMQAYQTVYDHMINIDQFFIANMNLRQYIYEGKEIKGLSNDEAAKVMTACEMVMDLFEEIVGCRKNVPKDKWNGWENYILSICGESKAIQHYIEVHGEWYSAELIEMLNMKNPKVVSQDVFGWELVLDLYNCDSKKVRSHEMIVSLVRQLCEILDVKRYGEPWMERFGHGHEKTLGYTAVQLIETSSIVIHFSELYNSVYLEIFSCKQFDHVKITEFCQHFFEAESISRHFFERKLSA